MINNTLYAITVTVRTLQMNYVKTRNLSIPLPFSRHHIVSLNRQYAYEEPVSHVLSMVLQVFSLLLSDKQDWACAIAHMFCSYWRWFALLSWLLSFSLPAAWFPAVLDDVTAKTVQYCYWLSRSVSLQDMTKMLSFPSYPGDFLHPVVYACTAVMLLCLFASIITYIVHHR